MFWHICIPAACAGLCGTSDIWELHRSNTIQTGHPSKLCYVITGNSIAQLKVCRDGVTCAVFLCSVLLAQSHAIKFSFGTAIRTSFYNFE